MNKNRYSLTRFSDKKSYDWWWHSLVAKDTATGELKPFFIEYYVVNPGLWKGEIVLGQNPENKKKGLKPSYAMLKVGTWGDGKVQLNNYYNISDFKASKEKLDCKIGENTLTDYHLKGEVSVSEEQKANFPEWMSDAGNIKWDLKVDKLLKFDVGFGSSWLFNLLNAFHMYWHVEGMKCRYEGEIIHNNKRYIVEPETSYGYQDKNWGKDYTNPWIWLNCNNFVSKTTGNRVDASLDLGGGCPKVFGVSLNRRILTAFYYKGEFMEFNFSKFWKKSKQEFSTHEDEKYFYWEVISESSKFKIDVKFKCEKSKMLLINYESPNGNKDHDMLRNGGHAFGTVKVYKKESGSFELIDELEGSLGGCEYGEF